MLARMHSPANVDHFFAIIKHFLTYFPKKTLEYRPHTAEFSQK